MKSWKFYQDDYGEVKQKHFDDSLINHNDAIRDYFGGDRYYQLSNEELINNTGELAADELTEYLARSLFPLDGSWLNLETIDVDKGKDSTETLKTIRNRVANTNFYSEIPGLIKSGLSFNKGIMDCSYANGVNFCTLDIRNVYISPDFHEGLRRVYIIKYMTYADAQVLYKSLPPRYSNGRSWQATDQIKVVEGYVPYNERFWGSHDNRDRYRYARIEFLDDKTYPHLLERVDDTKNNQYYTSFPFSVFKPNTVRPLALKALSTVIALNEYELMLFNRADYANDPAKVYPPNSTALFRGKIAKGSELYVDSQEREPTTVKLNNELPFDMQMVQKKEQDIYKIFKFDLILRSKLAGLTAPEDVKNFIITHEELQPLVSDIMSRTITGVINRMHNLCRYHEASYREATSGVNIKNLVSGSMMKVTNLKKAANAMRFVQSVAPIAQLSPQAIQNVNADEYIRLIGSTNDVPELVHSPEDVDKERQAMAAQQQQAEPMAASEDEKNLADAELKQAQAAQLQSEGGLP